MPCRMARPTHTRTHTEAQRVRPKRTFFAEAVVADGVDPPAPPAVVGGANATHVQRVVR